MQRFWINKNTQEIISHTEYKKRIRKEAREFFKKEEGKKIKDIYISLLENEEDWTLCTKEAKIYRNYLTWNLIPRWAELYSEFI